MKDLDLDFIRHLIDIVDQHTADNQENESEIPSTHHYADDFVSVVDNNERQDDEGDDVNPREVKNALDKDNIYIPPLQQRIEMLKKLTGVNPKDREILSHIDADDPTAS